MPRINADGQLDLMPPASDWHPPVGDLPMLRDVTIGLDTETKDGGLARGKGPGWVFHDGYVLGVSVAWPGGCIYVPVRHPDTENRPITEVIAWVEHLLRHCHVCFFNMGYDMGWLQAEGCTVWPERAEDGHALAFMLDENYDEFDLDSCCGRAGILGKDETLLDEAAASLGIQRINGSVKHGLWRMPGKYVGPYGEQDAISTLELCRLLRPLVEAEGTMDAYQTEIKLRRVTNAMRWRGIPVSTTAAERAKLKIEGLAAQMLSTIEVPWQGGCTIEDLRSPERLAKLFDAEGVEYPRTDKTKQPSFKAQWLEHLDHPLGAKVRNARKMVDLAEKFLGTYILGYEHRGRIHASIRELKPVTHRFAYADPPLQQMPSRDGELAPLIRNVFEPEEGTHWLAADFKGQEPRLNVHYAFLAKKEARKIGIDMGDIDAFVRYYREDPDPDLHQFNANLMGVTRKEVKDMTQAMTYRAGFKKIAGVLNLEMDFAESRWNKFHETFPYIGGLARYAEAMAQKRGYVRMIDGARRHYSLWQPKSDREKGGYAFRAQAEKKWPGQPLERAFCYQAANGVVQGSAARQMKRAMVHMYEAGYLPSITMHDENGANVTSARECREIGEIMSNAVRLVVPVTVDLEVGKTWGTAKVSYEKVFG